MTKSISAEGGTKNRFFSRGRAESSDSRFAFWLVFPSAAIIIGLLGYPILYAAWLSLHDFKLSRPQSQPFVGLTNFVQMAQDPEFLAALGRTTYFTVLTVGLGVLMALGLALLLAQEFRGSAFARTLLLVPWAVPPVVNGIMWRWIYDGNYGALNWILLKLGVISETKLWLGTPESALNAVVFAELWKLLPFITLIILASLQGIPRNLYRAARVDGANAWQRFIHITLPSLRNTLILVLILQTMWSIKVFDVIYVLTQGGPANGTTTLFYYGYLETFKFLDVGYGSAVAFTIMLLVLVLTCGYITLLRRQRGSSKVAKEGVKA
jgi:multiple sugar transport system permease protein